MIAQPNPAPASAFDSSAIAPPATPPARPMYWSVRRELWENRSIYFAPMAAAGIALFGSLIRTIVLAHRMRGVWALDPARQNVSISRPLSIAAAMIIFTAFIVGVFYCLEALHGERRDRSILFWKSLPVSDLTTVLAKASIPLVVLPLICFVLIVATQLTVLALSTAILASYHLSAAALWTEWPLFEKTAMLVYALVALALWHAPIYGWLLLVSGWARRAAVLWAFLPVFAALAIERLAFNSSYVMSLLKHRLAGAFTQGFIFQAQGRPPGSPAIQPNVDGFLSSPGLWVGLIFAAAFLAAAARLRRDREPI